MATKEIPELNVGIVGHIDHGKTTLLSKLTGKFADTHSEELKRGITIKLGYAEVVISKDKDKYNTEGKGKSVRYISFIDAPGHEMLMATMLSGAATIDAAILVVAANEGIKPQTREHLMALKAKKVKNIIIVQNKIDLVDKKQAQKNYQDIKEFIKGTVAENSPIIPVSAQQEVNIERILEALIESEIPKKNEKANPIFLVARSFDINRPGTLIKNLNGGVLGGILKEGVLKIGDEIEIKPGISLKKSGSYVYIPLKTKIRSLHRGKDNIEKVFPGVSISIETELDPNITKTDSLTGCIVSKSGVLPEVSTNIKIKSELFKEIWGEDGHKPIEPLKTKDMLMLSVNTTITVGIVEKIDKNIVELSLNIPIVAINGDNIGIARNINGHWRLIGQGEIVQ